MENSGREGDVRLPPSWPVDTGTTLYRELKGQEGSLTDNVNMAYLKYCDAVYLGVLVGIVGSIDTRAPSGSTIIMAVFLQKIMKVY